MVFWRIESVVVKRVIKCLKVIIESKMKLLRYYKLNSNFIRNFRVAIIFIHVSIKP